MRPATFVDRHQLVIFFAVSLFAWTIWMPQAALRLGLANWAPSQQSPVNALTVWSPGIAAIVLTALTLGKGSVGALFRPLLCWRVGIGWYLFAMLFEPVKWVLAFGVDRLVGFSYELGAVPLRSSFGSAAAFMVPVALVFTLPNSLGEELGWRAYALPRLQEKHGALPASVFLGLFWGVWHVPMWVAWAKGGLSAQSLLIMAVSMVPVAVLFTWLFNRTGQSLLLACLFHASMAAKGYLTPRLPTLTETAIVWTVAIAVVALGGLANTRRTEPATTDAIQ